MNKVIIKGEIVKQIFKSSTILVVDILIFDSNRSFIVVSISGKNAVSKASSIFIGSCVEVEGEITSFKNKRLNIDIPQIKCKYLKLLSTPDRFKEDKRYV